jgi:hypothetical protein
MDRLVVEEEGKKLRAKLVVSQWAGTTLAGPEVLPQSEEAAARHYEARHALEGLDFAEFVRCLRKVRRLFIFGLS